MYVPLNIYHSLSSFNKTWWFLLVIPDGFTLTFRASTPRSCCWSEVLMAAISSGLVKAIPEILHYQ